MLKEARRDVVTSDSELEFDRPKEYQFKGLPAVPSPETVVGMTITASSSNSRSN